MSNEVQYESFRCGWCASVLALCAGACSGETVDVGEVSRDLAASASRCQDSSVVQGSVTVENQEQLDQLEGCDQIDGNLYVRPFEGADFRPLGALTEVRGALELGRMTVFDINEVPPDVQERSGEIFEREQALLDAGWITSLEGFEDLVRAGSLTLSGVGSPDLAPLSNLSALTNGAALAIGPCTILRDLTDLERLVGVTDLNLTCESLQSLAGPRFAAHMSNVYITGTSLADLGALSPESVNDLRIEYTALEHLDALSRLSRATSIDLWGNASLVDADALDTLNYAGYLRIAASPLLERLPELNAMYELSTLRILANDALTNVPSLPNVGPLTEGSEWGNLAPEDALRIRPDLIQIVGNPALESVAIPAGWLAASYLEIAVNDRLTSIDLASLHAVDRLVIGAHPALTSVNLGLLETVDDLRIIENPLLPLEPFDAVQTFRRIVQPGPLQPDQY